MDNKEKDQNDSTKRNSNDDNSAEIINKILETARSWNDDIKNPHDKLFFSTFKNRQNLKNLFKNSFTDKELEDFNLDKAEILDGHFINESMNNSYSDLLVKIPYKGEDIYV